MNKKYSKKNGFYKYYNKEGLSCRIKVPIDIKNEKVIMFVINNEKNITYYTIPNKKFKNVFDFINYICKNLETDNLIVEVSKY